MADTQKELFEDLKRSIERTGDILFYKIDEFFDVVREERNPNIDLDLSSLVEAARPIDEKLTLIDGTLNSLVTKQHSDLIAISNGNRIDADIVKSAIAENNEISRASVSRIEDLERYSRENIPGITLDDLRSVVVREERPNTVEAIAPSNDALESISSKAIPVLDSAATFLKNWSSPTSVGAALAIPIVGGIGVAAAGLYFIFDRIADSIDLLSNSVTSIAKGGISGLILGQTTASAPASESGSSAMTGAVIEVRDSVIAGSSTLADKLTAIGSSTSTIADRVSAISLDGTNSAIERLASKLDELNAPDLIMTAPDVIAAQSIGIDYSYQEKILDILRTPVEVKLVDQPAAEADRGDTRVDVFSTAVRPLIDGQISLQNMLDGNLRRLTEAVASLREVPRETDQQRTTRVTDTLNTEMSDEAVNLILGETRVISAAVLDIKSEFISFKSEWISRSSEQTRGSGSIPTPKSMN